MGIIEVIYYDKPAQQPQEKKPGLIGMMQEARRIEKQIERLEDSIRRLDGRKYRCTSSVSDMPRGGQKADWYDIDAEIETLEQQISELRKKRSQLTTEMDMSAEADMLTLDEYKILKYKYISEYTFDQIAVEVKLSQSSVYRNFTSAKKKLGIK